MNTNTDDIPYRKYVVEARPTVDEPAEDRTVSGFPGGQHNVEQKPPNRSERKSTDDAMRELEKGFGGPWEDLGSANDVSSAAFAISPAPNPAESSRGLRRLATIFDHTQTELSEAWSKMNAMTLEKTKLELENVALRHQLQMNSIVPVESSLMPPQLDSSTYTAGPVPSRFGEQYEPPVQGRVHHQPTTQHGLTSFRRHESVFGHPNSDQQTRIPFHDPMRTVGLDSFRAQESENAQTWRRAAPRRWLEDEEEEQHGNYGAR